MMHRYISRHRRLSSFVLYPRTLSNIREEIWSRDSFQRRGKSSKKRTWKKTSAKTSKKGAEQRTSSSSEKSAKDDAKRKLGEYLSGDPPPHKMTPQMERQIMKGLNFFSQDDGKGRGARQNGEDEQKYSYVRLTGFHNFLSVDDILDMFPDFELTRSDVIRQYQYQKSHHGAKDLKSTGLWFLRVRNKFFLKMFDHRNSVGCFTGLINLLKIHEQDWTKAQKLNAELFDGDEDRCVIVSNIPDAYATGAQVRSFLSDFHIKLGALRVHKDESGVDGYSGSNYAIVPFESREEAQRAVLEKHLEYVGSWRVSVTPPSQNLNAKSHNRWHQAPTNIEAQ